MLEKVHIQWEREGWAWWGDEWEVFSEPNFFLSWANAMEQLTGGFLESLSLLEIPVSHGTSRDVHQHPSLSGQPLSGDARPRPGSRQVWTVWQAPGMPCWLATQAGPSFR